MEQSIELYSKIQDPLAAIERMGKFIGESGMFGCQKVQQGMVIAAVCLARRIDPLEFIQTYHLIQGKPSMRADEMLARFQDRGGEVEILSRTAECASVRLTKKGGKPVEFALTWADAQEEPFVWVYQKDKDGKAVRGRDGKPIKSGLKDNYATPRGRMQMLWARVVSDGIRTVDPRVNNGLYTPEENADPIDPDAAVKEAAGVFSEKNVTDSVAQPPPKAATGATGVLDQQTQSALLAVIPAEWHDQGILFLRSVGWLADDQMWDRLSSRRAQTILDRPQAFVDGVRKWAETNAGRRGAHGGEESETVGSVQVDAGGEPVGEVAQ